MLREKAVAIDLGPIADRGIVAETPELMQILRGSAALAPVGISHLYALLDYYCDPSRPLLGVDECQIVHGFEIPDQLRAQGKAEEIPAFFDRPLFAHVNMQRALAAGGADGSSGMGGDNDGVASARLVDAVQQAGSLADAADLVADAVMDKVAATASVPRENMQKNKTMQLFGIDSLVIIELRNWFLRKLGADVPVFDISADASFEDVARKAVRKSRFAKEQWKVKEDS